jgi:hypothetical protein
MPFSVQQTNATTRLLAALETLRAAVYDAAEQKERAALLSIPPAGDFPPLGELSHLDDRAKLVRAHAAVDLLQAWLRADNGGLNSRKPLDVIVEALR